MSTSTHPGHATPACPVVRDGAAVGGEVRCKAISGELKEAYRCAGGCQGRGAVKKNALETGLGRRQLAAESAEVVIVVCTNSIGGLSFGLHGCGRRSFDECPCGREASCPSSCAGGISLAGVGGIGRSAKMRRQCCTSPVGGPATGCADARSGLQMQ